MRRIALAGALAILALGGGLVLAYRNDLQAHRERIATGSRIIETHCGPVELAEAGSGPPLLLVHGTGGGFDQGMNAGRDFAARGLRVIAPAPRVERFRLCCVRKKVLPAKTAESTTDRQ